MRIKNLTLVIGVLAIAGCGAAEEAAYEDDGATTADTEANDNASADGFPDGFSLYPGGTIYSQRETNLQGRPGTVWVIQSDDSPEKMITYYMLQGKRAGLEMGKINSEDTASFVQGRRESDQTELLATANRAPGAELTSLNLTIVARASQ